jgi:hypothetical protein
MKSSSRNGARVRVLAVHTTEGIMRAVDLRAWTAWPGSSHAAADDTGVLLDGARDGFVDHARAAWTLRSGNPWSENIELCAHAKWTRAQWLARPTLLELCAVWLARRSAARGIPLVKITPAQYRAGASGVIGHHDHTVGYSDGTHWDPGPGFPWDVVLARARQIAGGTPAAPTPTPPPTEDLDMTPEQDQMLRAVYHTLTPGQAGVKHDGPVFAATRSAAADALRAADAVTPGVEGVKHHGDTYAAAAAAAAGVAQLLGRPQVGTDPATVASAIAAAIPANLAQRVADELATRLRT